MATEASRNKAKFRQSKKWKCFRKDLKHLRKYDEITMMPLHAGFAVHHCDMHEEHYADIDDETRFRVYNKTSHRLIHFLYNYYVKDPTIIDRIRNDLEVMKLLNED